MFLFAPGPLPAIRLAHTKYEFFPVRRLRVRTVSDAFVCSPIHLTTLSEKDAICTPMAPGDAVYLLLAAIFGRTDKTPLAYTAGLLHRKNAYWPEDSVYFAQARYAARTINPEDSLAWAYAGNQELMRRKADEACGSLAAAVDKARQTPAGIAPGDLIAVAAPVKTISREAGEIFAGVNGIGSVKLLWH